MSGASITSVTLVTDSTYTVAASTGTGNGTLGLNLVDDDSITDISGNKLGGTGNGNGNFTGQAYDVQKSTPTTTTVTFEAGPYTYRGTAFTAIATVTGVGGFSQSVPVVYSGDCTNVTVGSTAARRPRPSPATAATRAAADSKSITISQGDRDHRSSRRRGGLRRLRGTPPRDGHGGRRRRPQRASSTLSGTTHTNARRPTAATAWQPSPAGPTTATPARHRELDSITKATATIVVTPYAVAFDGSSHTATGTATGVGGADLSASST